MAAAVGRGMFTLYTIRLVKSAPKADRHVPAESATVFELVCDAGFHLCLAVLPWAPSSLEKYKH